MATATPIATMAPTQLSVSDVIPAQPRTLLLLSLALAGCADRATSGGSHLEDTPLPPLPAREPTPPAGHSLRFRATDGRRLTGVLYPAARSHAPAVVLVHGVAGRPRQWDGFVVDLHRAGFAAFPIASRSRRDTDEARIARDVAGAVRALRGRRAVDPARIALAGTSVGGSAVAFALGARPRSALGGVAFSAVAPATPRPRPHDLLLITDPRERATARAQAGPGVTVAVTTTAGHGSALLRDPAARRRAVAWLRRLAARR